MQADTQSVPCSIERYEVLGCLALGGMAEILLGRLRGPRGFARVVVIKRVLKHLCSSPAFVDMFLDEARIVAQIRHPNVVQVHELGQDGQDLFLVMEYLEGESVGGIARRMTALNRCVSPDAAAAIIADACAGLHAAHELTDDGGEPQHLVHRDVSPQNIFVTYDGAVKLIDFGIAKAAHRIAKTEVGVIKGKSAYMSPEQCMGAPIDRRSDIFSLGVVMFELCTGHRLFARDNDLLTFKAICEDAIPSIRDIRPDFPARLEAVCRKALARRAEDRYPTARAFRGELVNALRDLGADGFAQEQLGALMLDLFADRRSQKNDMLASAREGSAVLTIPDAETDAAVSLPIAPKRDVGGAVQSPQRRRGVALGIVAAAVAVGAYALVGPGRQHQSKARPALATNMPNVPSLAELSQPSSQPAEVVDEVATVRFSTIPPGAQVIVEGNVRGTTPITIELERRAAALPVELVLSGHLPRKLVFTPDSDKEVLVTLHPDLRPRRQNPSAASDSDGFRRFDRKR